ncbi:MAG: hypothetical protein WCP69_11785 [Bacteroidota bacterium]
MKRITLTAIACIFALTFSAKAQDVEVNYKDSTGLPGDNFSLQGALEMFKNAKSLEDFEKMLNQDDNKINNLDLNDDGKIDYVRVVDNVLNNAHAIVLQVPINKTEFQDIAVIEIEKQGTEKVSVQIVGDEDIYGENIFYEPNNENEVNQGNVKGGPSNSYCSANIWFNAWYWPCVTYMYAPHYVVWVSPWYWDYYPQWWRPWNPYSWRNYYGHCYHYHHHYYRSYHHYGTNAYNAYRTHHRSSDYVVNRHRTSINNYRINTGNNRRNDVTSTPENRRKYDNPKANNIGRSDNPKVNNNGRSNNPNVNTNNNRKIDNSKNNYSKPRIDNGQKTDNSKRNQGNSNGNYNRKTPTNNGGSVNQNKPGRSNQPTRSKPTKESRPASNRSR